MLCTIQAAVCSWNESSRVLTLFMKNKRRSERKCVKESSLVRKNTFSHLLFGNGLVTSKTFFNISSLWNVHYTMVILDNTCMCVWMCLFSCFTKYVAVVAYSRRCTWYAGILSLQNWREVQHSFKFFYLVVLWIVRLFFFCFLIYLYIYILCFLMLFVLNLCLWHLHAFSNVFSFIEELLGGTQNV